MNLTRILILVISLIALVSCGKDSAALTEESILKAQDHLSVKNCSAALESLESVEYDHTNARYLKTLSSAYACFANYSTINFFMNDILKTVTPAPIGGMTTYSSSLSVSSTSIDSDSSYQYMVKATEVLLFAGGIDKSENPSKELRAAKFSAEIMGDLNNQLAFMLMVELGKFMKIYGDTNEEGEKGGGPLNNKCFASYDNTNPFVQQYLNSGNTGSCSYDDGIGHPDLQAGATNRRVRMCRGITAINNLLELLPEVISAAGGGDVDSLLPFIDDLTDAKESISLIVPGMENTMNVKGQKSCEDDPDITDETLESAFVAFFESMVL